MENFKDRLMWARKRAGFDRPIEASRRFNWPESTYYGHENGDREMPRLKTAKKYASAYKVRWEWLFHGSGDPVAPPKEPQGSLMVPRISWVSAGRLTREEPVSNVDLEDFIEVAALPAGDWVAFTVRGDSMNRVAPDGSTIVVNRADQTLRTDAMYVFRGLESGEATFKRYREGRPPRLQPYSFDPDSETQLAPANLGVFGRVRRVIIDV